jgi:hypothetical protein
MVSSVDGALDPLLCTLNSGLEATEANMHNVYRLLRTHSNPANICKTLVLLSQKLANMDSANHPETRMSNGFTTLFSADQRAD